MKLRYFSWLKKITNKDYEILNNKDIKDIKDLKKYLCKKYPKMEDYLIKEEVLRIAVNLEYTSDNKLISNEDEIALFPPVSGG
jgi:molybdopterin synthase sulfur carrier subunit